MLHNILHSNIYHHIILLPHVLFLLLLSHPILVVNLLLFYILLNMSIHLCRLNHSLNQYMRCHKHSGDYHIQFFSYLLSLFFLLLLLLFLLIYLTIQPNNQLYIMLVFVVRLVLLLDHKLR